MNAWQRLGGISALRFTARSAKQSGWNGSGEGSVVIERPSVHSITFTESGQWQTDQGNRVSFSNVFRWSPGSTNNAIRLEHLRFGVDKPVYLFEMDRIADQVWRSTVPHVCGDDVYSASMNVSAEDIQLQWTIKGPKKDEDIRYWYW